MTDDKAREILNVLKEYERAYQYSKEEVVEALDMAVKVFERREKILSYIDRLLNQGTGKKKSLEFLKKYILEGEKNDE